MRKITTTIIACCLAMATQAQTFEDVIRFSRQPNPGTARSAAMGGAFTALGGDISATTNNPAGIGVFRKSELSFTPLLNFAKTEASGEKMNKTAFQMGGLGGVLSLYSPAFNWKGINIGFYYNNLNNFNRTTRQIVPISDNSFTDILAITSGNLAPDQLNGFTTGLAYDAFLINNDPETGYYYSILGADEDVAQVKDIEEKGYQGEYTIAFGTNFKDKLYFGASIGIQSICYKMTSQFQEAPDLNSPSGLDYYQFLEYKKMNGVGTNIKLGVIYRPIPELRIGAAIHSPTWFSMNYTMSTAIDSYFITPPEGEEEYNFRTPSYDDLNIDYDMRTPWRATAGLATVLGQRAIISADYEFIKYTNACLKNASDNYSYQGENDAIKFYLHPTHNFRTGAEIRANSIVSLRAGYSFWNSPYYESKKSYNRIQSWSTGIGLNFGAFYCDAAFTHRWTKNETIFYSYYDTQEPELNIESLPTQNKLKTNEARITFGIRF